VQAFNPGGFGSTPLSFTWTVDAVPPTAAVALPAAVTGSLAVTFSTPVDGIGPATVVLSQLPVSGPPVTMPATLTCVTQANVSGTCVGASFFTKVLVQPAAQLVPGQHYVLTLNPTGVTPAITDQAGNVLVTVAHAFRGGLVQDDDSPAAVPSWTTVTAASASGGSYAVADLGGSTASFTFTGTAITWHTVTGPGQGDANVYVDGVLNAAVDNYSATTRYKVARTVTGLTAGAHSLRIVVRGVKGAAAGTGTQVAVDDFEVGTTVTQQNAPGVHYTWTSVAAPAATGGRYAEAELAGAKYSFTFRGTAVRWVTVVGPAMGEAAVYLDGVLKSTVNGYASRAAYGVGRSLTGLTDAVHTLVVVVLGKHTAPSTANTVAVDGFVVS
jgi:hypothetical protein